MSVPRKIRAIEPIIDGQTRIKRRPPSKGTFTKDEQKELLWQELQRRMSGIAVSRKGILARLLGWLSSVMASWADRLGSRRSRPRLHEVGFSTNDEFLEVCWQMIHDTDSKNLVVMESETREEAVRRVIADHLAEYRKNRVAEFEAEFGQIDGQAPEDFSVLAALSVDATCNDPEPQEPGQCCHSAGCGCGRKTFGPDDPMLEAVRRERMKKLLSKKGLSDGEKSELQDLLSKSDVVVLLDEVKGKEGDKRGVDHPEH
jgi:hypothetical protein